ncbi:MarR family transcriptional regulator [Epibacterium sp. SM1969]|uniref:MarR family transcriptional regulator n=1 Tax=Tritonibacter aquimaris TaxID=2663379 RepID=A0A844AUA6_9RHOB|nr:MarR family transcriptional regulator [Tritonibacter aquimaris]MQY42988.1 MarR family transcriptional regulator [Tritonibacter aquimaris]
MTSPQSEMYSLPSHLIRRLNQICVAQFTTAMSEADLPLTPVQYSVLWAVEEFPGVDQASVAKQVGYDRATLGKVVDRLELKGFVSRVVSKTDRRAREIYLSEAGKDLLLQAHPVVLACQDKMLPGVSDEERAQLVELLARVAAAANTETTAPILAPLNTQQAAD